MPQFEIKPIPVSQEESFLVDVKVILYQVDQGLMTPKEAFNSIILRIPDVDA